MRGPLAHLHLVCAQINMNDLAALSRREAPHDSNVNRRNAGACFRRVRSNSVTRFVQCLAINPMGTKGNLHP